MPTREQLITENLGLVRACAARFKGRGIEYEDLCQIGCVGLIKAADGFDAQRGLRFSTYAVPTILGEIKRVFRDTGQIKVSRALKETALRLLGIQERLEQQNGRDASIGELVEQSGLTREQVCEALCVLQPTLSLTLSGEEGDRQNDLPAPPDTVLEGDTLYIEQLLCQLTEQERRLVRYRFYEEKTQTVTARLMGMTQVQVSRHEKRILQKLKELGA